MTEKKLVIPPQRRKEKRMILYEPNNRYYCIVDLDLDYIKKENDNLSLSKFLIANIKCGEIVSRKDWEIMFEKDPEIQNLINGVKIEYEEYMSDSQIVKFKLEVREKLHDQLLILNLIKEDFFNDEIVYRRIDYLKPHGIMALSKNIVYFSTNEDNLINKRTKRIKGERMDVFRDSEIFFQDEVKMIKGYERTIDANKFVEDFLKYPLIEEFEIYQRGELEKKFKGKKDDDLSA